MKSSRLYLMQYRDYGDYSHIRVLGVFESKQKAVQAKKDFVDMLTAHGQFMKSTWIDISPIRLNAIQTYTIWNVSNSVFRPTPKVNKSRINIGTCKDIYYLSDDGLPHYGIKPIYDWNDPAPRQPYDAIADIWIVAPTCREAVTIFQNAIAKYGDPLKPWRDRIEK